MISSPVYRSITQVYLSEILYAWFMPVICFWLPLIIVSPLVRRTDLKSSLLNWEGSFPFWQRYAHVTDHVEQQAAVIFSALLCKNLDSTWTHSHLLLQGYWDFFIVAAKLKLALWLGYPINWWLIWFNNLINFPLFPLLWNLNLDFKTCVCSSRRRLVDKTRYLSSCWLMRRV